MPASPASHKLARSGLHANSLSFGDMVPTACVGNPGQDTTLQVLLHAWASHGGSVG